MTPEHRITATKHDDGTISVDGFPDTILVSNELLALSAALPGAMSLDDDRLIIRARNGQAVYVRTHATEPRSALNGSATWFARLYGAVAVCED